MAIIRSNFVRTASKFKTMTAIKEINACFRSENLTCSKKYDRNFSLQMSVRAVSCITLSKLVFVCCAVAYAGYVETTEQHEIWETMVAFSPSATQNGVLFS